MADPYYYYQPQQYKKGPGRPPGTGPKQRAARGEYDFNPYAPQPMYQAPPPQPMYQAPPPQPTYQEIKNERPDDGDDKFDMQMREIQRQIDETEIGYEKYYGLMLATLFIVAIFVGYKSGGYEMEKPSDDGDDEDDDYVPPKLDEDELNKSTIGGGGNLYIIPITLLLVGAGIAALVYFVYGVRKVSELAANKTLVIMYNRLFRIPPLWIMMIMAIYAFVVYISFAWSSAQSGVGGPLTPQERLILSFGVSLISFAMISMFIALYKKAQRAAADQAGTGIVQSSPAVSVLVMVLTISVAVIMGHIAYTHIGFIEWLEENVIGYEYRSYLVPTVVLVFLLPFALSARARNANVHIPMLMLIGSLMLLFYLQAQVHTKFGRFQAVANIGLGKVDEECAKCDVFHQYATEDLSPTRDYSKALCDTNAKQKDKDKYKKLLLLSLDAAVKNDKKCEKVCGEAKKIVENLTCKCTEAQIRDEILCPSVATLQFYTQYHRYNNDYKYYAGDEDEGYGWSAWPMEVFTVIGVTAILTVGILVIPESMEPNIRKLSTPPDTRSSVQMRMDEVEGVLPLI